MDLRRARRNHLGPPSIFPDIAGYADSLPRVFFLRRAEFRSVLAPDHNRKDLIGIRLIQIQKRGLPLAPLSVPRARDCSANRSVFANMLRRFSRRQLLLGLAERGQKAD